MFKKDSILMGMACGAVLPTLVFAYRVFMQHRFGVHQENMALYLIAIAFNLIAVRFAYTYQLERVARGIIASSFVICLLVFYLSKQAL